MARQDNNREHENAPRKIRGARAQRSCVGACKSTAPTHVRDRVRDKTKDIKDGRDKRWKREDNREKTEDKNAPRSNPGARTQRPFVGACRSTVPTGVRVRVRDETKEIIDGIDKR